MNPEDIRILVVDDDPDVLPSTAHILREAKFQVITGTCAAEAMELAHRHRPALLLQDVELPDGNGRDVARQLKVDPAHADLFVILVSGTRITVEEQVRGLDEGMADGYITRPFTKAEFLARINAFLRIRATQEALRESLREREKVEMALREREESLSITLQSIGDGVIATDSDGRITRMNPVAERLTGWHLEAAAGRPMTEVFRIVNAHTREPVPDPVQKVLAQGEIVGLANHTVLLARDGQEYQIADSAAPIRNRAGQIVGVVLVFSDVSEQYRMRDAMRQRMVALTQPLDNPAGLQFSDLFDLEDIQRVQDQFANAMGVASIITTPDGTPITRASNFTRLCFEIIRGTEKGRCNCFKSDAALGRHCPSGPIIQRCLSGGLWDAGASITVGGKHVANWLIGQVRNEEQDEELMLRYADEIGADREAFRQALVEVPFMSRKRFEQTAQMIFTIAQEFSSRAYQNIQQARFINERQQAEEELRESEKRLEDITFSMADWVWEVDSKGVYTFCSQKGANLLGRSQKEIIGKTPFDFMFPDEARRVGAIFSEIAANKAPIKDLANWFIRKNGEVICLLTNGVPMLDETGNLKGYRGVHKDITEHEKMVEALRKSQSLLEETQQISKAGGWEYDVATARITWTDETYRIHGVSKDYTPVNVGLPSVQFYTPEDQQRIATAFQQALETGRPFDHELQLITPQGTKKWVRTKGRVERQGGEIVRVFGNMMDITERKQAEEALRETKSILQAAMDNSQAGIAIADAPDGRLRYVNKAGLLIRGKSEEESIAGIDIDKYVSSWHLLDLDGIPLRRDEVPLARAVMYGETCSRDFIIRRPDNEDRIVWANAAPILDSNGRIKAGIVVFQDITERKQMEANLLRTQRMESLGTLASGVAHDLNNILTPILFSTEMLRDADEFDTRESLLETIEQCAKRGANVVNQVLVFARGAKGERTTMELKSIVNDLESMMCETFPKNIAICSSIPPDFGAVIGNSTQIHQVFLNLCINARDAMPKGGTLSISAEKAEIDEAFAAMAPDAKAGNYAMLSVTDTGIGIPHEIIGKIFEPFFTTKEHGKGTGLGLSSVIGIVRSHGGFVTVESKEGRGSTFKVFLPIAKGDSAEHIPLEKTAAPHGMGETILVVDDEAYIAKMTAMVLRKHGFKVLVAAGGDEALALYREHANAIAIVLTDIMMPGMDGVELSHALQEINPRVKIIASTGQATETRQAELRAVGVEVILRKPYNAKTLLATLHDAIHPVG